MRLEMKLARASTRIVIYALAFAIVILVGIGAFSYLETGKLESIAVWLENVDSAQPFVRASLEFATSLLNLVNGSSAP